MTRLVFLVHGAAGVLEPIGQSHRQVPLPDDEAPRLAARKAEFSTHGRPVYFVDGRSDLVVRH